MILGSEHARNDRNLRTTRNELAHQFTGQAAIQRRLHADDAGTAALGGIGGYANYTNTFLFRIVNERSQIFWISCGENNSVDAALYQFPEYLGISFCERLHGTIHELNPQLSDAPGFIQDSAPKLVVEIVNLPGHAHPDSSARFGNGQSASRQIRGVADLSRNLQNPLARGFLDPSAPVQGAIHSSNRDLRHLGDQVDSTSLFSHF